MMEVLEHLTLPDETEKIQQKMSRADMKLKDIELQLQNAQKHFNDIKKRLAHMKNVCEERGLIDSKGFPNSSTNSSHYVASSVQESHRSSVNEYLTSYNTLNNIESCYEDTRTIYSYTSKTSNTKSIIVNNDAGLAMVEKEFQAQKYVAKDIKPSVTKMTIKVFSDEGLNDQSSSEEKMSISTDELSSNSQKLNHLDDLRAQKIFKPFPSTPKCNKKSQLIFKINAVHEKTSKQYKRKNMNKIKKNLSHANLIMNKQSQSKKIHEHSCQTIRRAAKKLKKPSLDYVMAKSRKKFKRQGLTNRKEQNIKIVKEQHPSPAVVELYHNTATKHTTPSAESRKKFIELQHEMSHEDFEQNHSSIKCIQNKVVKDNSINFNFVQSSKERLHQLDLKGQFSEAGIQDAFSSSTKNRKKVTPDEPQADHHHRHDCQSRSVRSYCCKLAPIAKSYQQPTISSQLKKVEKGFLTNQVNFENLPFINGTSISPSHNIGLNIQQVLSSLKTKQHQITPDLQFAPINKTGKTFNSTIQSLLETLNANSENCNTDPIIESKSLIYSNAIKDADNSTPKVEQSDELAEIKQRKPSVIYDMQNLFKNIKVTKSKNSLSNYQNFSTSGKFENTMRKIHDRFNVLNKKYEHLQNQLLKTNDKKIRKELIEVENELNEKEEEINAIVGLCFEVAALKRQIKMQNNSSLLYITTKCSTHNSTKINSSTTARPQSSRSLHITEYQQRKIPMNKKVPPATKVFVGLLRNIQSIQHQLTTI